MFTMHTLPHARPLLLLCLLCFLLTPLSACGDPDIDKPAEIDSEEVITTLNVTMTSQDGEVVTATFRDADGPGGDAPVYTQPTLKVGDTYTVELELLNETVPSTDEEYQIGDEIKEEAEDHQFFFDGSALSQGLLSYAYADKESDYTTNSGADLPVGIKGTVVALKEGSGELTVVLQHQPPINDVAVKTATSGKDDGSRDLEVTFDVNVTP